MFRFILSWLNLCPAPQHKGAIPPNIEESPEEKEANRREEAVSEFLERSEDLVNVIQELFQRPEWVDLAPVLIELPDKSIAEHLINHKIENIRLTPVSRAKIRTWTPIHWKIYSDYLDYLRQSLRLNAERVKLLFNEDYGHPNRAFQEALRIAQEEDFVEAAKHFESDCHTEYCAPQNTAALNYGLNSLGLYERRETKQSIVHHVSTLKKASEKKRGLLRGPVKKVILYQPECQDEESPPHAVRTPQEVSFYSIQGYLARWIQYDAEAQKVQEIIYTHDELNRMIHQTWIEPEYQHLSYHCQFRIEGDLVFVSHYRHDPAKPHYTELINTAGLPLEAKGYNETGGIKTWSLYAYDKDGGLIETVDLGTPDSNHKIGQVWHLTRYALDAKGQIVEQSKLYKFGDPIKERSFVYDNEGNLLSETFYDNDNNPNGSTVYRYLEYDDFCNWTVREVASPHTGDQQHEYTEARKIDYYE
jgi:hypothetical protein